MTRFAIILAVPFFVACGGAASATDACTAACDTLSDAELTACETAYDACAVGATSVTETCQAAVIDSYELLCDTTDTDVEDTDAAE